MKNTREIAEKIVEKTYFSQKRFYLGFFFNF